MAICSYVRRGLYVRTASFSVENVPHSLLRPASEASDVLIHVVVRIVHQEHALFDVGGLDSFAGTAPYQFRGNYYGVGSLEYRFRIGRLPPTLGSSIYAITRGDAGKTWFNADDVSLSDLDYGLLIGLAADSNFGALIAAVGKAEGITPRFYLSLGNAF